MKVVHTTCLLVWLAVALCGAVRACVLHVCVCMYLYLCEYVYVFLFVFVFICISICVSIYHLYLQRVNCLVETTKLLNCRCSTP